MSATGIPILIPAVAASGTVASTYKAFSWVPDSSGSPTATARAVYTDPACLIPATNPVTLGASVRKVYKKASEGVVIVIKSADEVTTYDTIHFANEAVAATGDGWAEAQASDYPVFATYAAMTAASVTAGMVCKTISYNNILDWNDGSSGDWLVVASGKRNANGGTILDHDTEDLQFIRLLGGRHPNNRMWGAKCNRVNDDTTATQAAVDTLLGWDLTTASTQTGNFNAVAGNLYPVNTTSAAITATLPATPAQGDRVGFYDSNNTFDTNNFTVARNGNNIEGSAANVTISREGKWYVLEYDATNGWCIAHVGGMLELCDGTKLTASLVIDESTRRAVEESGTLTLIGTGPGSTNIFTTHADNVIEYQGNVQGYGSHVQIRDFSLHGPGSSTAGSVGIWMDNCPWFGIDNVHIWGYERGTDCTDQLSGTWRQVRIRFCKWGSRWRFADASRPNSIVLDNCNYGNNSHYAGRVEGGAGFEIRAGQNEGNGQVNGSITSGGGAWFFIDCGVEGKTGVTVHSTYTEGTGGDQSFYFEQTTGSSVHTLLGCSFANISSSYYVSSHVRTSQSGGAYLRVNAISCGFGALNDYVESASRRYINAQAGTFRSIMCRYESATATSVTNWDEAGAYARKRGLILSNNGSDATNDIDISAGGWLDSTFADVMILSSGITKRLDAAWAVGTNQGGLDTGSIADTTYHVWLIKRFDTGVTDVLFSTSATAPTMPSGYDYKVRIGSIIRSSGAILAFDQVGDTFILKAPGLSFTADNGDLTTARVTKTLAGIPTGIIVDALLTVKFTDLSPASDKFMRVQALTETDATASSSNATHMVVVTDGTMDSIDYQQMAVRTNTSAQIGARTSLSDTDTYLSSITRGWRETWRDAA